MDSTRLMPMWERLSKLPGGKKVFSVAVGRAAPYTGSIGAVVQELEPGMAMVSIRDRRKVRNHLRSVHAIALMNLGEVSTGLASLSALPKGGRGIIVELSMKYIKKARGTITATCRTQLPTSSGAHDHIVEGVLTDSSGAEVARARATWRLDIP